MRFIVMRLLFNLAIFVDPLFIVRVSLPFILCPTRSVCMYMRCYVAMPSTHLNPESPPFFLPPSLYLSATFGHLRTALSPLGHP